MTDEQHLALCARMMDLARVALPEVPAKPRIVVEGDGYEWRVRLWRTASSRGPALLELLVRGDLAP